MNAHRVNWRSQPGDKGRTRHAPNCGAHAKTVQDQKDHADVYQPGVQTDTTEEES